MSKFQQRHYEAVANVFKDEYWYLQGGISPDVRAHAELYEVQRKNMVTRMAKMFQSDNPRFKLSKFLEASKAN